MCAQIIWPGSPVLDTGWKTSCLPSHHVPDVLMWEQQTRFLTFRLLGVHSCCGVGLCFQILPVLASINNRQGCCLVILFLLEPDPCLRRQSVFLVSWLGKEEVISVLQPQCYCPACRIQGLLSICSIISEHRIFGFDESSTSLILLLDRVSSVISIGHSFQVLFCCFIWCFQTHISICTSFVSIFLFLLQVFQRTLKLCWSKQIKLH